MSQKTEIKVPDIGDFEGVEVIEILASLGDTLAPEDPLITLETDKAAMDVPSPVAGKVVEMSVKAGDHVSEGDVIAILETVDEASNDTPSETPATSDESSPAGDTTTEPDASPPPAAVAAPAEPTEMTVSVPDIGDFDGVDVIEVMVGPGDRIVAEDALITLETDKAAMDIPSPATGEVLTVSVKVADKVSEGDAVLTLLAEAQATAQESAASGESPAPAAADPPAPAVTQTPVEAATLPAIDEKTFSSAHAGPSVRKLARELGVDLARVKGSGHKNRISDDDVKAWVKATLTSGDTGGALLPKVPAVDFSKFGEVEVKPLSRIQKISGPRLHAAWVNLPHVFQFDEADITDLEARRKSLKPEAEKRGVKVTPLAFILRACVLALREFPVFNSSLDATGENLVYKQYCHLGFAADTPNGLMVPVIRDADRMDVFELASHLGELSAKARDGKLRAAEMQGGCFTVSSLGGIGGTGFTPIINAPEVAIMGVARSSHKPVYVDGGFIPRLILPFSVSYDHRVIDGAVAVRFTSFLATQLTDVDKLLEAVP